MCSLDRRLSQPMDVALWLAAVCAAVALGYPDGAPDDVDVLRSMLPHHSPGPQRGSTSPYELEVTETDGTLRMQIDGEFAHRGFLITVAGAENGQLGAFQQPPPPGCRLLANGTAATHASAENKQQTLVVWTLPANRKESTYVIYYTVVMTFSEYWVNLSRTVTVSAAETSEQASTHASPDATAATDYSGAATNAITVQDVSISAANAESAEQITSTEQQLVISGSPSAGASPSPLINAVTAAAASTGDASAAVIDGATTSQDAATAATNAASGEPAISTEQQLFTSVSPSVPAEAAAAEAAAVEAIPPASPMAVSSAPAAYANTILVASLTATAAGAPRAG